MIPAHHQFTNVWEVIQINGHNLLLAVNSLSNIKAVLDVSPSKAFQNQEGIDRLHRALDFLTVELEKLDLKLAIKQVKTIKLALRTLLKESFNAETIAAKMSSLLDELQARIQDDLETRLLYSFNSKEAELIESGQERFSEKTQKVFSAAAEDLEGAVKCLGFSQYTACVFHLMRAMERALHAIGDHFKATIIDKNDRELSWGIIVANVNDKVKEMPKGTKRDKWSHIMTSLHHVNICWRNDTMHPKQTYKEEEAHAVLSAVRSFLDHLAKELDTP